MKKIFIIMILFMVAMSGFADPWNDAYSQCEKRNAEYKVNGMVSSIWGCWESLCGYEACLARNGLGSEAICQPQIQTYNQCMSSKKFKAPSTTGLKAHVKDNDLWKFQENSKKLHLQKVNKELAKKVGKFMDAASPAKMVFNFVSSLMGSVNKKSRNTQVVLMNEGQDESLEVDLDEKKYYVSPIDAAKMRMLENEEIEYVEYVENIYKEFEDFKKEFEDYKKSAQ